MASLGFKRNNFEFMDNNNLTTEKDKPLITESARVSKREIYDYKSACLISSVDFSHKFNKALRLAIASYLEQYDNYIRIVQLDEDSHDQQIRTVTELLHPYPATRVKWAPRTIRLGEHEVLASSADHLRIWRVPQAGHAKLECLLNANSTSTKTKPSCPLTSFDWNDIDTSLIVTSNAADNTCTLWNLETNSILSGTIDPTKSLQLTCHQHRSVGVYDVSFSRYGSGRDVFVSCGRDGTVRMCDIRHPNNVTIIYDNIADKRPLLRVSCSQMDPNLIATFAIDSNDILVIDLRYPGKGPRSVLRNHCDNVKAMSWAPHLRHHICSGADDGQTFIWDISRGGSQVEEIKPSLTYKAKGKINGTSWSSAHPDWIAICYRDNLELLRV